MKRLARGLAVAFIQRQVFRPDWDADVARHLGGNGDAWIVNGKKAVLVSGFASIFESVDGVDAPS